MSNTPAERKVAIVTGGSRGIGLEIARALVHRLDMTVVIVDIVAEQIENLAATFGDGAEHVDGRVLDVTDSAGFTKLVEDVAEQYGHIDVLVNNAGITRDGLVLRMSDADFEDVIRINLTSAFYGSRAVAKYMVRQRGGAIVNISSFAGVAGNPGQANYSASKAGMLGLTKTLAKELAVKNVRCNAVAPGFIKTDMTDKLSDKQKEAAMQFIPLRRMGLPEDIARAVVFLASEDSDYVTGQVLCVDGGMHT